MSMKKKKKEMGICILILTFAVKVVFVLLGSKPCLINRIVVFTDNNWLG